MKISATPSRLLLAIAAGLVFAAPAAHACLAPGAKVSADGTRGAATAAAGCRTPVARASQRPVTPGEKVQINPQPLPPGERVQINPQPLPPKVAREVQ